MSNTLQIQNDVILGREGFLFLGGGAHTPYDYATGERKPSDNSKFSFWQNIRSRALLASQVSSIFMHLLTPDKINSCEEVFPLPVLHRLSDYYLGNDCSFSDLVYYPLTGIQKEFRDYCYKVDSHYNPYGTSYMLADALKGVCSQQSIEYILDYALSNISCTQDSWAGDLGSKLNPAMFEPHLGLKLPNWVTRRSNHLSSGNNGIIDVYTNSDTSITEFGKVLFFGDSFGRGIAELLSLIARQVAFLRTPFMHADIVRLANPDLIITQNAERYLSSVKLDRDAPIFFLYPFLKEGPCTLTIEAETAQAISDFFTS